MVKLIKEDKRETLIHLSLKLEGLNRNVATQVAGVVIADKKLTETVSIKMSHLLLLQHNLICTLQKMQVW